MANQNTQWKDAQVEVPTKDGDYLTIMVHLNKPSGPVVNSWSKVYLWGAGGSYGSGNVAYWTELPKTPRLKRHHKSLKHYRVYFNLRDGVDGTLTELYTFSASNKTEAHTKAKKLAKNYTTFEFLSYDLIEDLTY